MRDALRSTTDVLSRRAALYRNLVVVVAASLVLSPAAALAALSWKPLLGLLAVPVACGVYLAADHWTVLRWKRALVARHRSGDLDLAAFRAAAQSLRYLPGGTVRAMLETLPGPRGETPGERTGR